MPLPPIRDNPYAAQILDDIARRLKRYELFSIKTHSGIQDIDMPALGERFAAEGMPFTSTYIIGCRGDVNDKSMLAAEYGVLFINNSHSTSIRKSVSSEIICQSGIAHQKQGLERIALQFDSQPLTVVLFNDQYTTQFTQDVSVRRVGSLTISEGESTPKKIDSGGITCMYGIAHFNRNEITKEKVEQVLRAYLPMPQ